MKTIPTEQKENKLYVFPPQKEWKHLDTPEQRKEVLQIPANVLSQISKKFFIKSSIF